jgi:hypothetical protein
VTRGTLGSLIHDICDDLIGHITLPEKREPSPAAQGTHKPRSSSIDAGIEPGSLLHRLAHGVSAASSAAKKAFTVMSSPLSFRLPSTSPAVGHMAVPTPPSAQRQAATEFQQKVMADLADSSTSEVVISVAVSRQAAHEVELRNAGYEMLDSDLSAGGASYPVRLWQLRHNPNTPMDHVMASVERLRASHRPDISSIVVEPRGFSEFAVLHVQSPIYLRSQLRDAGFVELTSLTAGATLCGLGADPKHKWKPAANTMRTTTATSVVTGSIGAQVTQDELLRAHNPPDSSGMWVCAGAWIASEIANAPTSSRRQQQSVLMSPSANLKSGSKVLSLCMWFKRPEMAFLAPVFVDHLAGCLFLDVQYTRDLLLPKSQRTLCEADDLEVHAMAHISLNGISLCEPVVSDIAAIAREHEGGDDWEWQPNTVAWLDAATLTDNKVALRGFVVPLQIDYRLQSRLPIEEFEASMSNLKADVRIFVSSKSLGAECEVGACLVSLSDVIFEEEGIAPRTDEEPKWLPLSRPQDASPTSKACGRLQLSVAWRADTKLIRKQPPAPAAIKPMESLVQAAAQPSGTAANALPSNQGGGEGSKAAGFKGTPDKAIPAADSASELIRMLGAHVASSGNEAVSSRAVPLESEGEARPLVATYNLTVKEVKVLVMFHTEMHRNAAGTLPLDDFFGRVVVGDMMQTGCGPARHIAQCMIQANITCASAEMLALLAVLRRCSTPADAISADSPSLLEEFVDYITFLQFMNLPAAAMFAALTSSGQGVPLPSEFTAICAVAAVRHALREKATRDTTDNLLKQHIAAVPLLNLWQQVASQLEVPTTANAPANVSMSMLVSALKTCNVEMKKEDADAIQSLLGSTTFSANDACRVLFGVAGHRIATYMTLPESGSKEPLVQDEIRLQHALRACGYFLSHQRMEAAFTDEAEGGSVSAAELQTVCADQFGVYVDNVDLRFISKHCGSSKGKEDSSISVDAFLHRYLDLSTEERVQLRTRLLTYTTSRLLNDTTFVAAATETFALFSSKPADALHMLSTAFALDTSIYRMASQHVPQTTFSRHFVRACQDIGLPLTVSEMLLLCRMFASKGGKVGLGFEVLLQPFFSFAFTAEGVATRQHTKPTLMDRAAAVKPTQPPLEPPQASIPAPGATDVSNSVPPPEPVPAPAPAPTPAPTAVPVSAVETPAQPPAPPTPVVTHGSAPESAKKQPSPSNMDTSATNVSVSGNKLVIDIGSFDQSTIVRLLEMADPVQKLILAQLLQSNNNIPAVPVAIQPLQQQQALHRERKPAVVAPPILPPPEAPKQVDLNDYPLRGPFVPRSAQTQMQEALAYNFERTAATPPVAPQTRAPPPSVASGTGNGGETQNNAGGNTWTCELCLQVNDKRTISKCFICHGDNPFSKVVTEGSRAFNWMCTTCGFPNLPGAHICIVCDKTLSPPIASDVLLTSDAAADVHRGHMRADATLQRQTSEANKRETITNSTAPYTASSRSVPQSDSFTTVTFVRPDESRGPFMPQLAPQRDSILSGLPLHQRPANDALSPGAPVSKKSFAFMPPVAHRLREAQIAALRPVF